MNDINKLLQPRSDSMESGLCCTCIHLIAGKCDTGRPCGQVMACRAQARAMVVGRYPSGRVRKSPKKRTTPLKKDLPKPLRWKKTRVRMRELGETIDCVWIKFLSDSQQVSVRRFIKKGRMAAFYIDGADMRGAPALFVSRKELDEVFGKWEVIYD